MAEIDLLIAETKALISRTEALISHIYAGAAQSSVTLQGIASSYSNGHCDDAVDEMERKFPGGERVRIEFRQQLVDQARQRMATLDAFWVSILTGGLMSGFDDPVIVY